MLELPDRGSSETAPAERGAPRRLWLWLLCAGALVWVIATAITALTRDTILVPTVILLGSFLVPVTVVAFALARPHEGHLKAETLLLGFLAGGTLGVLFSALTETYLLPSAYGTLASVGVIEEGTKGLVLVAVARMVLVRRPRDGIVLGATVGAGFASFESAGYALSAVIGHADDHPILRIVESELNRAVLAPFGHITWTALLGGALFAAARAGGSLRLGASVVGTFAGVAALHGAWDASYGWAIMLTQGLEGDGWSVGWPNTEAWVGAPTGHTLLVFQVVYGALLVVNSLIGGTWLLRRWRRYGASRDTATA